MGKTAIIFPGQGAQYENMGKDFYDTYESARNVFQIANEVSPIPMETLIFQKNEALNETRYTQVAMLCVELAILKVLKEEGIKGDVYAGLSLGEYAALTACGALTTKDALSLIVKRGALMQEAVPTGGAMAAVLGIDNETIEVVCKNNTGIVSVANYNCPGQSVITGEERAVNEVMEQLKSKGAKRCIRLNVSGPFHSVMLKEAGKKLYEELKYITIHKMHTPYVTNVTASYVTNVNATQLTNVNATQLTNVNATQLTNVNATQLTNVNVTQLTNVNATQLTNVNATQLTLEEKIKDLLMQQIYRPVLWQQSVESMIDNGVDQVIEVGPKKTLCGFMKKINKEINIKNVETVKDLKGLQLC